MNAEFTVDWFSAHIPTWEEKVLPRLKEIERPAYLEIGSFEGRSLLWMLDNVPNLYAVSIDSNEDKGWERFRANVGYNRAIVYRDTSSRILPTLSDKFDLIYIDGSHWAADVLSDTILAWRLLNSGGVMVWDDYGWIIDEEEIKRPKPAIDAFLTCYRTQYKVLHIGYQFIVEKVV